MARFNFERTGDDVKLPLGPVVKEYNNRYVDGLRLRREGGFTLIELLVVIAILGILAAVAALQLGGFRRRSFDSDVRSNVKNLAQ